MRFELWNTRNNVLVAVWDAEEDAREQLRENPGLAAEALRLVARSDGGEPRVLAESEEIRTWAGGQGSR